MFHYLSHRAVVKEDHETTKTTIVFDASAKYQNQKSPNHMLDPGSYLLPHIFHILVRFRLGQVRIITDIKRAFLQISIDKNHSDFLRMIWYENVFDLTPVIKLLRFARSVFTLISNPFIFNGPLYFYT